MSIICQWIWRENLYGLCSGQFIQSFIYLLKVFLSFIYLFTFSTEFLTYDSWFFIYRNSNGNISHLLAYFPDVQLLILMFSFIVL